MAACKKSRRRTRSRPRTDRNTLKVLLAALFLLAFVIASLVLLAHLGRSPSQRTEAPETSEAAVLAAIRADVESVLAPGDQSLGSFAAGKRDGAVRFEIPGKFPDPEHLERLARRLHRRSGGVRMAVHEKARNLLVTWREKPLVMVHFVPRFPPPPSGTESRSEVETPRVAIIMDDLGRDPERVRKLLDLELPLTFSILPGEVRAAEVAEEVHRAGGEILVHLPMEPLGYPAVDPGRDAMFVNFTPEQIRRRVRRYLRRVPFAVGGNNHMGSRFTADREGMAVVLEELEGAGLFFVDSLTTGKSVAYREARRAGVPTARRDRFLDNVPDAEKISLEIRKLVALAERRGQAIGICHPYEQTLEALRREGELLRGERVKMVPVSRLLVR